MSVWPPLIKPARLLLSMFGIAALLTVVSMSTVRAQNADARVELILEGLPAKGSPAYNALLRLAGDAQGQVLPLSKTEMWAVRRSRLDALKKAATAQAIKLQELGDSWNELVHPMAADTVMDVAAKSMMDRAMQSKSTAGMAMMSTKPLGAVEYALTKGINDKGSTQQPKTIKIAINDKTVITAVRSSVVVEGDHRCIWRGVVEGTGNPVTILWWASGRITGTVHQGDRLYQLRQLGQGTIGIVETMMDKMPDEHARASPKRMQDMQMQQDTLFMQGDSSAMRPKRSDVDNQKDDIVKGIRSAVVSPAAKRGNDAAKVSRPGTPAIVIDVMVVYTAKAAANYSDIKRDLIELAIEDTNQSFKASGIGHIGVRLVHTHETDYKEEGAEHFDHVWRMVDKGDGFMEEVPALRDEKKADVVVLIVDDPSGCGLATRVAANADEAYVVAHHECAATSYSVAHEIGHIIGTRHDRSLDQSNGPFPFGHGFVSPDLKWRTMMSYKAGCNGCPRLPIWSTPAPVKDGRPAGSAENNNARVISEQAARVAAFR